MGKCRSRGDEQGSIKVRGNEWSGQVLLSEVDRDGCVWSCIYN